MTSSSCLFCPTNSPKSEDFQYTVIYTREKQHHFLLIDHTIICLIISALNQNFLRVCTLLLLLFCLAAICSLRVFRQYRTYEQKHIMHSKKCRRRNTTPKLLHLIQPSHLTLSKKNNRENTQALMFSTSSWMLTHCLNAAERYVAQPRLSHTDLLNLRHLVRQHPDTLACLWTGFKEHLTG